MVIWFGGGLGNQMFQYSLYLAAQKKGINVEADLSHYKQNNDHNGYELKRIFNINLNESEKQYNIIKRDIISRVIRKAGFKSFGVSKDIIWEQKGNFIKNLINEDNLNKYLIGYWQSEKYFKHIKSDLYDIFRFPDANGKNREIINDIKNHRSVSIHVRRGDYLNNSIFYCLGDSQYYNKAVSYFMERYSDVKFYVFSDNADWCKDNLNMPNNTVFIDWNTGTDSYIDIQLMSSCQHNIIANSSFSWWGAWLNPNKEKMVIAPANWFDEKSGYNSEAIIPKDWIIIDT